MKYMNMYSLIQALGLGLAVVTSSVTASTTGDKESRVVSSSLWMCLFKNKLSRTNTASSLDFRHATSRTAWTLGQIALVELAWASITPFTSVMEERTASFDSKTSAARIVQWNVTGLRVDRRIPRHSLSTFSSYTLLRKTPTNTTCECNHYGGFVFPCHQGRVLNPCALTNQVNRRWNILPQPVLLQSWQGFWQGHWGNLRL